MLKAAGNREGLPPKRFQLGREIIERVALHDIVGGRGWALLCRAQAVWP